MNECGEWIFKISRKTWFVISLSNNSIHNVIKSDNDNNRKNKREKI